MSAASVSTKQALMEEERRAHEPSMEEILASIRRIIADDDALSSRREAKRQDAFLDEDPGSRRRAIEPAYPAPTPQTVDSKFRQHRDYVDDTDAPVEALNKGSGTTNGGNAQLAIFPSRRGEGDAPRAYREDMNDATTARVSAAPLSNAPEPELDAMFDSEDDEQPHAENEDFDSSPAPLVSAEAAASVASHFEALATSMLFKDSGVLEEYAKDMLRPMLKQWLDDNLPVMVERLIRAEIERVARGRR
jgi:cell pole-organizing protein PopZ